MKRWVSLGLLMMFLLTCLFPVVGVQAAPSASISLNGPSTVRAGDTITIAVYLFGSNVEGVDGNLFFDTTQLMLTDKTQKIAAPWKFTTQVVSAGKIRFMCYDDTNKPTTSPINSNVQLFTVTFKVATTVPTGSLINIGTSDVTVTDKDVKTPITNKFYEVTTAAPLVANTNLSVLGIAGQTLTPAFNKDITNYSASVPFDVSKATITATPEDATSRVKISDTNLKPGVTTTITITVTAQTGASKAYTIIVARTQDPNYVANGDADLKELHVSSGQLSPLFSPADTYYIVWLPYEVTTLTVTGKPSNDKSTVSILGEKDLIPGQDNAFSISVTAENRDNKTYTVIAKRGINPKMPLSNITTLRRLSIENGILSPAFDPQVTTYTVTETAPISIISVDAQTTDHTSIVKIFGTGEKAEDGSRIVSVMVTAQDGSQRAYHLLLRKTTITATPKPVIVKGFNQVQVIVGGVVVLIIGFIIGLLIRRRTEYVGPQMMDDDYMDDHDKGNDIFTVDE